MNTRTTLTCPHCLSHVPHGASVCRACKVEIEYGIPDIVSAVILFGALFVVAMAHPIGQLGHLSALWFDLIVGGIAFGGFSCLAESVYSNAARFTRYYRGKGNVTMESREYARLGRYPALLHWIIQPSSPIPKRGTR